MKKLLLVLMFTMLVSLVVVFCDENNDKISIDDNDKVFINYAKAAIGDNSKVPIGAEGVPQPGWVRNVPKETEDIVYFVGVGVAMRIESAKIGTARADALRQLALWVGSETDTSITDNIKTTRFRVNTAGLKQKASWVAPDGSYRILFSYPKKK